MIVYDFQYVKFHSDIIFSQFGIRGGLPSATFCSSVWCQCTPSAPASVVIYPFTGPSVCPAFYNSWVATLLPRSLIWRQLNGFYSAQGDFFIRLLKVIRILQFCLFPSPWGSLPVSSCYHPAFSFQFIFLYVLVLVFCEASSFWTVC